MIQGKTNSLTSQSCKPLPYDCTSVWASRYYFQHVFCTFEFNEQRWNHQNTKMYKRPSRSIVRTPQNFFTYYTSDWNVLVTWTKLLKHQCQVSRSKQTCMCFLTYICNYLFLFHTLFYYKNGNWVFHLTEVLLYQACENGSTLGQALQVCCSVVQSFLSNCCQNCATKTRSLYNGMWLSYPMLLLVKRYYRMKIVWVILCQYYQGNIHIHFLTHLSKMNFAIA